MQNYLRSILQNLCLYIFPERTNLKLLFSEKKKSFALFLKKICGQVSPRTDPKFQFFGFQLEYHEIYKTFLYFYSKISKYYTCTFEKVHKNNHVVFYFAIISISKKFQ